ncbi:MAG: hypothetical protein CMP11_08875 [Zetaproteobacteria bacterium]|nr:hypothetical protein [Pseudobdellovibrionaceae bacterium]|tara:strand:+ start:4226 stop:4969 length:744 start_codon:yes stop_codon:yes gene_type:complete
MYTLWQWLTNDTISQVWMIIDIGICVAFLSSSLVFIRFSIIIFDMSYLLSVFILSDFYSQGMKAVVLSSLISITVNTYKLVTIYLDRSLKSVPKEFQKIYLSTFSFFTPREFSVLIKSAKKTTMIGTIAKQGSSFSNLYLTLEDKQVEIKEEEQRIANVSELSFICDLSFLGWFLNKENKSASKNLSLINADVSAPYPVCMLVWSEASILLLDKKIDSFGRKITSAISLGIADKLLKMNEEKTKKEI